MKTLVTAPVVLGTLLVLVGQPTGTVPSGGAKSGALVGLSAPPTADASHVNLGLDTHIGENVNIRGSHSILFLYRFGILFRLF